VQPRACRRHRVPDSPVAAASPRCAVECKGLRPAEGKSTIALGATEVLVLGGKQEKYLCWQ
jgi:hypothetical protein